MVEFILHSDDLPLDVTPEEWMKVMEETNIYQMHIPCSLTNSEHWALSTSLYFILTADPFFIQKAYFFSPYRTEMIYLNQKINGKTREEKQEGSKEIILFIESLVNENANF